MSDGPRVIAQDGKLRIVKVESGEKVTYLLEKQTGCDGLGVERWNDVNLGTADTISRQLRDWIITMAVKAERGSSDEPQ